MKKKNGLRKAAIKLDLEKIEIDVLTDSMLNGLQGGYVTQPGGCPGTGTGGTQQQCTFGCQTQAYTCTDIYPCSCTPCGPY